MAVLPLDTVVDESMKKMADRAVRSPARLCRRDAKFCHYRQPEYVFIAFWRALLTSFLLFLRPYPGMYRLFALRRLCTTRLLLFSRYVFSYHMYSVSSHHSFGFISFVFRCSYFLC